MFSTFVTACYRAYVLKYEQSGRPQKSCEDSEETKSFTGSQKFTRVTAAERRQRLPKDQLTQQYLAIGAVHDIATPDVACRWCALPIPLDERMPS